MAIFGQFLGKRAILSKNGCFYGFLADFWTPIKPKILNILYKKWPKLQILRFQRFEKVLNFIKTGIEAIKL